MRLSRFGRPIANRCKYLLDRHILNFPPRTTSSWITVCVDNDENKTKESLRRRELLSVESTQTLDVAIYENISVYDLPEQPYSLMTLNDLFGEEENNNNNFRDETWTVYADSFLSVQESSSMECEYSLLALDKLDLDDAFEEMQQRRSQRCNNYYNRRLRSAVYGVVVPATEESLIGIRGRHMREYSPPYGEFGPIDGVRVPFSDESFQCYGDEHFDNKEIGKDHKRVQKLTVRKMDTAKIGKVQLVRKAKSVGDLPSSTTIWSYDDEEDDSACSDWESEDTISAETEESFSSSSNDADISSCDEDDRSFCSCFSEDYSSCSDSVSYLEDSDGLAKFDFSLTDKSVQIISSKPSNMQLNVEKTKQLKHFDMMNKPTQYLTNSSSSTSFSSKMSVTGSSSAFTQTIDVLPEYNLFKEQQELRNCAIEACNMDTFLQLIENSFPSVCAEHLLDKIFFDYRQLVCQRMCEEEQQQEEEDEVNKTIDSEIGNWEEEKEDYFWP